MVFVVRCSPYEGCQEGREVSARFFRVRCPPRGAQRSEAEARAAAVRPTNFPPASVRFRSVSLFHLKSFPFLRPAGGVFLRVRA
jgi:hypothetical protein